MLRLLKEEGRTSSTSARPFESSVSFLPSNEDPLSPYTFLIMATTGGSLPSSTPTFVLLTAPLVELLLALLDDSLALDLPPDLRASLLLPLQPVLLSPSTDGSVKPRDPEISYDLVRKTGNWCTSVEGKEELKKKGLGELNSLFPSFLSFSSLVLTTFLYRS